MICKLEIYNGELNLFPVVTNERVFAQITMGNIVKGQPGKSPIIGENDNWWIWDDAEGKYVDSGKVATTSGDVVKYVEAKDEQHPNRKAIQLNNGDMITGVAKKEGLGSVNIAMVNELDVVDLGTSELPLNMNTPKGVRPTVQEAGQSREEANKIAYLSDIPEISGGLPYAVVFSNQLEAVTTNEGIKSCIKVEDFQKVLKAINNNGVVVYVSVTTGKKEATVLSTADITLDDSNPDNPKLTLVYNFPASEVIGSTNYLTVVDQVKSLTISPVQLPDGTTRHMVQSTNHVSGSLRFYTKGLPNKFLAGDGTYKEIGVSDLVNRVNDYMYDISLLMGKMAVRGTKGTSKTTQPYGSGYYHIDGSFTELGSLPVVTTVIVDENKVYHFDIGYHKYTNIADDAAVLVLFDENNKVLTAVPWAEGGFLNKYLVFTSEVKKYGVTYNASPTIKPYPSIYNETYEIEDINDVLSSMNTEIEASTASISAVEGNINTQQGNRALYVAAGAVYNEQTGFYELNGLTDITEEQMREIYVKTNEMDKYGDLTSSYPGAKIRANLGFYENTYRFQKSISIFDAFRGSQFEVLKLGANSLNYRTPVSNVNSAFTACRKLTKIIGVLDFSNITSNVNYTFGSCEKLNSVFIKNLKISIPFSDSPLLSLESLQYLITNAANTSAITVTVHADVYAKIQDETQTEWHALIASAQEKNITFATV